MALAKAISALLDLTDDELRQLHALIEVRLGNDAPMFRNMRRQRAAVGNAGKRNRANLKQGQKQEGQTRSAFADNPIYREYRASGKELRDTMRRQGVKTALEVSDGNLLGRVFLCRALWFQERNKARRKRALLELNIDYPEGIMLDCNLRPYATNTHESASESLVRQAGTLVARVGLENLGRNDGVRELVNYLMANGVHIRDIVHAKPIVPRAQPVDGFVE